MKRAVLGARREWAGGGRHSPLSTPSSSHSCTLVWSSVHCASCVVCGGESGGLSDEPFYVTLQLPFFSFSSFSFCPLSRLLPSCLRPSHGVSGAASHCATTLLVSAEAPVLHGACVVHAITCAERRTCMHRTYLASLLPHWSHV